MFFCFMLGFALAQVVTANTNYATVLAEQLNQYCATRGNVGTNDSSPPNRVGKAGPRGPPGRIGAQGVVGPVGPIGPVGTMGLVGPAGAVGRAGPVGPIGPVGPMGPVGPAGAIGRAGHVGPAGPVGASGPVGPAGPAGSRGPVGPVGRVGAAGPVGSRGPVGQQGSPGISNRTEIVELLMEKLYELLPWPLDCTKVDGRIKMKNSTGGVFVISPSNYPTTEVYCDLTTDGDGWTVFQRRMDGSVNFNTNWDDYVDGFGSPDKEYWMGLEKLHRLTSDGNYELRVDLEDWEGNRSYAKYSIFAVAGASDKYRLRVGGYSGSAGNSLNYQGTSAYNHDGQFFSTLDRDNDQSESLACAQKYNGGWWFNSCFSANLNGVYRDQRSDSGSYAQGIIWSGWKGWSYSLKFAEMKFRRKN